MHRSAKKISTLIMNPNIKKKSHSSSAYDLILLLWCSAAFDWNNTVCSPKGGFAWPQCMLGAAWRWIMRLFSRQNPPCSSALFSGALRKLFPRFPFKIKPSVSRFRVWVAVAKSLCRFGVLFKTELDFVLRTRRKTWSDWYGLRDSFEAGSQTLARH